MSLPTSCPRGHGLRVSPRAGGKPFEFVAYCAICDWMVPWHGPLWVERTEPAPTISQDPPNDPSAFASGRNSPKTEETA